MARSKQALEQEAAVARLRENLQSAGVEDFVMKKAVPGTPIPGESVSCLALIVPTHEYSLQECRKLNAD